MKLALRALVTAGLGYAVLRQIDASSLARSTAELDRWTLSGVTLLTLATAVCGALRWQRVLARASERVGFGALLSDLLVGSSYNMVLPASIGGDVVRALRCAARTTRPSAGYGSVLFERLLGLLTLAAMALLGALGPSAAPGGALAAVAAVCLLAMLVALRYAGIWLAIVARAFARFPRLLARTRETAAVLAGPLARSGSISEILGWSLLYQVCNLSIAAVVLCGLGEPRWLTAAYCGLPLALLIASAPVTIGGFGLREALFVRILADHGVSAERALLVSIVWVATGLALAVGGLVVMAKERAWSTA